MDKRVTKLQWDFLEAHIRERRMDQCHRQRVALKGKFIETEGDLKALDAVIEEWQLKEVIHGAKGTKPYRCQCGKSVRHLYVVKHRSKEVEMSLGSTCYKAYVGIDAEKAERVILKGEKLIAEREEILHKVEIGYIEYQKFLLDYQALDALCRQQLSLGLPLSSAQEDRVYRDLGIEDTDRLISRKKLIRKMTGHQLEQLNGLTPEIRQRVVARMIDGRILGSLDEVLRTAPDLIANRIMPGEFAGNRLEEGLIQTLRLMKDKPLDQRRERCHEDISRLLSAVDSGLIEWVSLVKVAREFLTYEQQEFWGGRLSGKQRREIARHILLGTNYFEGDKDSLSKKLKDQATMGIPLTDAQLGSLERT